MLGCLVLLELFDYMQLYIHWQKLIVLGNYI